MRAVHRRFEEFREDQERRDSFAAESSKGAQAVGERVQSTQAMAEDAGRAVASVRVAFEEYPADKPPVLNTILRLQLIRFVDRLNRSIIILRAVVPDSVCSWILLTWLRAI